MVSDEIIRQTMQVPVQAAGRPENLRARFPDPGRQALPGSIQTPETTDTQDSPEIRFLKDVQSHPDSGIAERYKRLGISVRQGQKIKAYLAADGLIEEQEERTSTGKLLRIQLTEEGRHALIGTATR
jgi:hypothetical protein